MPCDNKSGLPQGRTAVATVEKILLVGILKRDVFQVCQRLLNESRNADSS